MKEHDHPAIVLFFLALVCGLYVISLGGNHADSEQNDRISALETQVAK